MNPLLFFLLVDAKEIIDIYVSSMTNVMLNCSFVISADSTLDINITWSVLLDNSQSDTVLVDRNEINPLLQSPKFNLSSSFSDGEYNLLIQNFSRQDEGVYRCWESTEFGTNNALRETEYRLMIASKFVYLKTRYV